MTAIVESGVRAPSLPSTASWRLAAMIGGATLLALLLAAPLLSFVGGGGFGDPDDALRLAEVRAWMGGQPWFDVTALRLDPPMGASMHWSRLVDVPNAALIRLAGLVVDRPQAEAFDRIVLPTLLLIALYGGMARLATILAGRAARGPAILGTLLSGATLVQFQPGRIGHHAPETVVLVWAMGAALASFEPSRAREGCVAGGLVALALALSLETMPLLAALCVVVVLAWVWRGAELAASLCWFGAGLGLALPPLFLATVAPGQYRAPVADAFGFGHLGAGLIGAAAAMGLALASRRLRSLTLRGAAAGLAGLGIAGCLAMVAPELLHSPFAGVDPLVRTVWLENVGESKSLIVFMRTAPMLGLALVVPVALGAGAALVAAIRLEGPARLRFAGLGLLALAGLGLGSWQIRAFASVAPLALCGGLHAVARLRARLDRGGLSLLAAVAPLAILPFTATAWAIALPDDSPRPTPACLEPSAIAPLAALPAGRAVAPLEAGSHLIEATALDVFSAPYHRNNDGNRFALDVWGSAPGQARRLLADRKVTYVLTCAGMGDIVQMAARAPDGLAAKLTAGQVPGFLTPVPVAGTPYRVFKVEP